jgi:hypothetical protein
MQSHRLKPDPPPIRIDHHGLTSPHSRNRNRLQAQSDPDTSSFIQQEAEEPPRSRHKHVIQKLLPWKIAAVSSCIQEQTMPELLLSFLIAVAILAAMFVFIPMLDVCNDRCQRLFLRRPRSEAAESPAQAKDDLRPAA